MNSTLGELLVQGGALLALFYAGLHGGKLLLDFIRAVRADNERLRAENSLLQSDNVRLSTELATARERIAELERPDEPIDGE